VRKFAKRIFNLIMLINFKLLKKTTDEEVKQASTPNSSSSKNFEAFKSTKRTSYLVVPQDKKTLNRTIDVIIAFVIFIVKQF
jgi:hypothetical protein